MPDFNKIRYNCEKSSALSDKLVDEFLLYLCGAEEGLDKKFDMMLADYFQIIQKMPENWSLWLKSQYIVFRLFRQDGLAPKYLNHFQMRRRSAKEQDYFKFQIEHPWRFVFCFIEENPKDCFFEMRDILTGEKFLLYSPGVADIERQNGPMSLYFLLIGFNGDCWQCYGSNSYFKGIQPFDILYFAKQLKPGLRFTDEISELIEENPLPFMMLWVGAEFPLTFHKEDLVVIVSSSRKQKEELDVEKFNQDFIVKQKSPVYMFALKEWDSFPHYCKCFYDEEKKLFSLNATTDRGYDRLRKVVNKLGYRFPKEPENRVTMAMFSVVKEVLGREIEINPYERLFTEKPSPETEAELGKINNFLERLMDAVISGTNYDLRELAFLAGIEFETAKELEEQIRKKLGRE